MWPFGECMLLLTRLCLGVVLYSCFLGRLSAQPLTGLEEKIRRTTDRLPPPVVVKGETATMSKLTDRMEALHVPGVSIAVIHTGKIEWARGFGVTKVGGSPVTPDTLFQAA